MTNDQRLDMSKWKDANNNRKLEAFERLEAFRKATVESIDYDVEKEEAMNEKYDN